MNTMNNCCKKLHEELGCPCDCVSIGTAVEEKGKKFTIERVSDEKEVFCKIKVDGCLISSQKTKKADYAFKRCKNGDFYIVELKGSSVEVAFDQVCAVVKVFTEKKVGGNFFGFIVMTGNPKNNPKVEVLHFKLIIVLIGYNVVYNCLSSY